MEKFFKEIPYQIGIQITGWVPKLNGELRIDFQIDVKSKIQVGMFLGARGRIIKELRLRTEQLLMELLLRPVVCVINVTERRNSLE